MPSDPRLQTRPKSSLRMPSPPKASTFCRPLTSRALRARVRGGILHDHYSRAGQLRRPGADLVRQVRGKVCQDWRYCPLWRLEDQRTRLHPNCIEDRLLFLSTPFQGNAGNPNLFFRLGKRAQIPSDLFSRRRRLDGLRGSSDIHLKPVHPFRDKNKCRVQTSV